MDLTEVRDTALMLALFGDMSKEQFDAVDDIATRLDTDGLPVLDIEGNPLTLEGKYKTRFGVVFKPTKCVYGSGNMLDTFYRVYGITQNDLKEMFIECVNVKRVRGISNPTYPSSFTFIPDN
jgi:hypothetical protein